MDCAYVSIYKNRTAEHVKIVGSMLQAPATGFLGSFLIFAIGSLFWVVTPQHESFALMVLYSGMLFNIDTLRDGNMKRGENS